MVEQPSDVRYGTIASSSCSAQWLYESYSPSCFVGLWFGESLRSVKCNKHGVLQDTADFVVSNPHIQVLPVLKHNQEKVTKKRL